MRLSKIAILALRGTSKEFKKDMAEKLNTSDNSLYRWINDNEENGPLTTMKSLQLIREETGLNDGQILEEEINEQVSKEAQS
jgi:hypothetical protein